MALSFPLTLQQGQDRLRVAAVEWRLAHAQEVSRLADGAILRASLGAALWTATVQLEQAPHHIAAEAEALLALLSGPGASFLICDPRYRGPAVSPTLASIASNRRDIALSGFSGSLPAGAMLSYTYGASPLRYGLHRLVSPAVAGGTFEVTPPLRAQVPTGAPVTLERPVCKAVLLEAGFGTGRRVLTAGASFEIVQTLR